MKRLAAFFVLIGAMVPLAAYAQDATANSPSVSAQYQFQRQGIFDCNMNGAYAMSVGSVSAGAGAYVPVADATVELNTGILVYKECVLREVVDREREAAMAAFFKQSYYAIQTARNGNKMYVDNQRLARLRVSDAAFLPFLTNDINALDPALQGPIVRTVAQNYELNTRKANQPLVCPFNIDLTATYEGNPGSVWDGIRAAGTPSCNPVGAYFIAQRLAGERVASALKYQQNIWDWGKGYYDVSDNAEDPLLATTYTPSATVQQSFQTILDSPVRQLESANDIGQMINALYAGLTTHIISDTRGLVGLSQPVAGRPSYVDQLAAESAQGVRNAAANAALQILSSARQVEAAYFQAVNGIASVLTQAIAQLRSAEKQCWNLIVQRVCTGSGPTTDNTCTGAGGERYKVATSTAYSQPIIDSQITPLANATVSNVNASRRALTLIDQLIQGITNTASLDAQRIALQQIDSLVAQHALHIQPDLQAATQQYSNAQSAMTSLVQTAVEAWADSGDAAVGWCNVNNPAVIQKWQDAWRQ